MAKLLCDKYYMASPDLEIQEVNGKQMSVCTCVSTCVCTYDYTRVCVCVCICVYMYVCMYPGRPE